MSWLREAVHGMIAYNLYDHDIDIYATLWSAKGDKTP